MATTNLGKFFNFLISPNKSSPLINRFTVFAMLLFGYHVMEAEKGIILFLNNSIR